MLAYSFEARRLDVDVPLELDLKKFSVHQTSVCFGEEKHKLKLEL